MIPLKNMQAEWAECGDAVREAIGRVLASQRFLHGPEVPAFEAEWAAYCGAEHCAGVSSGTTALELAFRALGIGPGDRIVVPALSFIATLEAVRNVGAEPVFCDVAVDGNIEPLFAGQVAREHDAVALVAVCLHGRPVDVAGLRRHVGGPLNIPIVIDAAQAHGALWRDGGDFRDMGEAGICAWSFYPGKNLGALGDAGAVTADDAGLIETVRALRDHGRGENPALFGKGGNWRMDEVQAAALRAKLPYLSGWVEQRQVIARGYRDGLPGLSTYPILVPGHHIGHAFHHFEIRLERRDEVRSLLWERDHVQTGVHYPYTLPGVAGDGGLFKVAEEIATATLSLPMADAVGPVLESLDKACDTAFSGAHAT